jgi:hypothetical protein
VQPLSNRLEVASCCNQQEAHCTATAKHYAASSAVATSATLRNDHTCALPSKWLSSCVSVPHIVVPTYCSAERRAGAAQPAARQALCAAPSPGAPLWSRAPWPGPGAAGMSTPQTALATTTSSSHGATGPSRRQCRTSGTQVSDKCEPNAAQQTVLHDVLSKADICST